MSEWYVLDRDSDPAPGDPGQVRTLANRLSHDADLASRNTNRLRNVASADSELQMEGDYAPKFREALGELPDELSKMERAYRLCGNALAAFASSLEDAKTKAGAALRNGQDAYHAYHGALRQARSLLPADRQAMFSSGLSLNDHAVEAATADLDESVRAQVRAAIARARSAEADRERAKRLAQEAAELRGQAETTCANGIHDALSDSGIKNRKWYEKAWDFVSAPFRSWDAFVDLCGAIAMVAGIVALFVSGPIGWALMAAAMIAGAVLLYDAVDKYRRGEGSLWDVGFAVLGVIPFAPGAIRLAALAKGIPGALRGLRAAFPALRGGVDDLLRNGRPMVKRFCERDPIDVASGEMVLQQVDVLLPGVLPLLLSRSHVSSYRVGRWFGTSWASTLDQRIEVDGAGVLHAAADGALLAYPSPMVGEPVVPEEGEGLPLTRLHDTHYTITDAQAGHTLHFMPANGLTTGVMPLAMVTDRQGNRMELIYDMEGTLREVRHTGGYRITVDTTFGLITGLRLGGQTLMQYGYDHAGRLTEIINSSGQPLTYQYDAAGRITGWQDRNGSWYRYTYNADGYCVATSGSDGCLDGTLIYDVDNQITVITNSLGNTTAFHLDERLNVVREVNPLGHATVSEWDHHRRLLRRTDPLGRTTTYTYDGDGCISTITRPDGSTTTAEYNAMRKPLNITAPDGTTWRYTYDEDGNLINVTDPLGTVTSYAYHAHGGLASITDPLGHCRHVETNDAGIPVAVTTATGATTRYDRDDLGRVIAIIDPLGATTYLDWTIEGKLANRVLPNGATEHWRYDPEGNLVEHTDPANSITQFAINHFDLPVARITPDGAQFCFAYDTELRLVAVTNPQGLIWRYEYDAAGQLVREVDFDNRAITYKRDAAGQLVGRTNGMGQTVAIRYDLIGNMIEQSHDSDVITFGYDAAGRLTQATNADAEIAFTRDPLGRIVAETCNGRTVTSTYNALGNRTSRRTPTGAQSSWEYNPDGRPTTMCVADYVVHFGYDVTGREIQRQLGDHTVLAQTWGTNQQLESQTITLSAPEPAILRTFTYDANGRLDGVDDSRGGRRSFELDRVGRITTVNARGWTERYTYDPTNNIRSASWPNSNADRDLQGNRHYVGNHIGEAGKVRYEYDSQGRVVLRQRKETATRPSTWRYTWDAKDRLISVVTPEKQHWRYRYDALGRRIAKERVSAKHAVVERIEFTWDGFVLAEQNDQTTVTTWEWEPGSFRPLTQASRSVRNDIAQEEVEEHFCTVVTDVTGTPTELLDQTGTVVWQARATVWGEVASALRVGADCLLRFPGQYYDIESGLHYNNQRYYEPGTARYLSADPLGLRTAPNPYAYVPNPTAEIDPIGLKSSMLYAGDGWQKVLYTHVPGSPGATLDKTVFSGDLDEIAGLIEDTVEHGDAMPNWGTTADGLARDGTVHSRTYRSPIGYNQQTGKNIFTLEVVLNPNGSIRTAYPFG